MWYGWLIMCHQSWVGMVQFPVRSYRWLVKRYWWPVHAVSYLALMGECKETVHVRALPLTHHQCSNHCQTSCVSHSARKQRQAPTDHSWHSGRCTKAEHKWKWTIQSISSQVTCHWPRFYQIQHER